MSGKEDEDDDEEEEKVPTGQDAQDEYECKRRKRLELNRKAAQESRRRKKQRIEELQRSVVFLTRENSELREQNELLRQMLSSEVPVESNSAVDRFQAENTALKLALYESVQNLAKHKQATSGPMVMPQPNVGLMEAIHAGRVSLPHVVGLPQMLMARQHQSVLGMTGQMPDLSGFRPPVPHQDAVGAPADAAPKSPAPAADDSLGDKKSATTV